MTASIYVTILCDCPCGCGNNYNEGSYTIGEVRRQASSYGWIRSSNPKTQQRGDYCADCASTEHRKRAWRSAKNWERCL